MPKLEQPLFMEIGFPGPHPPFDPVPRWAETYRNRDLPMPDVSQADLDGQPDPLTELREHNEGTDHDSLLHQVDASPEERHRQRAYYYANVSMIDEQVGAIMDALEANGYDDTVVIFTSDHGEALGDHGHSQKWTMYDIITRVPTIVWAPDRFDGGRRVDNLCQLFDLGPTVLELADLDPDDTMAAESLLPALQDRDWDGRETVYAEHSRDGILQGTAFMTMVRTADWKLVHFVDHDEGQLFDLTDDPKEEHNRWNDPDVREKKRELLDRLLEWRIETGLESGDWAAEFR